MNWFACVHRQLKEKSRGGECLFFFFFSSKMFHALLFIVTINFIFTKRFEWPSTKTTRKILKGTLSDLILVLLHTHVYYHFLLGFSFRHVLLSDQNPPLSTGFLSNTWEEIFSLTKKKNIRKKKGKQPPYPWIKVSICREEPVGHTLPCATLRKRHPPHTHTHTKKKRENQSHT